MTAPDVLAFADKSTGGAYDVTEPSGVVVARIRVSLWTGASFQATAANGEPLCSGRRTSFWANRWEAVDPTGRALGSVRNASWTGTRKAVTLADGRELSLAGNMWGREWALRDAEGHDILSSTPTTGTWTFHPDAWLVRSHDASLDLAQVVGVVQLNRMMVKAGRSARVAAST